MSAELCPCGSQHEYAECCEPFIAGQRQVETAEQLAFLKRQGCDEVQGFYLALPMHATASAISRPSTIVASACKLAKDGARTWHLKGRGEPSLTM